MKGNWMFCPDCGAKILPPGLFCVKCGRSLTEDEKVKSKLKPKIKQEGICSKCGGQLDQFGYCKKCKGYPI